MKDAIVTLNGRTGILSSHLNFGDPRRGWDFRSLGRGGVNFEEIIRPLNQADYHGPLSVEWEDSGMDREKGAKESYDFVRRIDFEPSAGRSTRHSIKKSRRDSGERNKGAMPTLAWACENCEKTQAWPRKRGHGTRRKRLGHHKGTTSIQSPMGKSFHRREAKTSSLPSGARRK